LQKATAEGQDPIRITDRFFGPQMRGFDIRGIGPRVVRKLYTDANEVDDNQKNWRTDALGGRAYYMGRLEVEFPSSSALKNLGLRPSAFVDIGSVWNLRKPDLLNVLGTCTGPDDSIGVPDTDSTGETIDVVAGKTCEQAAVDAGATPGSTGTAKDFHFNDQSGAREFFLGNSIRPRLSVGVGVNWVSPFGPLRIDIAKALLKQKGDETKFFSFNVGTQF
jgi:outer membrane protein insertion porin family